jgi:putative transposase
MKKSRFSEKQVLEIVREAESGIAVADLSRKHGISNATIYNWRSKYAGMTESELKRLRQLEEENHRLKRMYANLSMDNEILRDVIAKKFS